MDVAKVLAERGCAEDYERLRVCGVCYGLYSDDADARPGDRLQDCRCRDRGQSRWERYDYNEMASLCTCCAMEALPSGHRFHNFFCTECNRRVIALDRGLGRVVIPIGRHTIMNGSILGGKDPSLPAYDYDVEALVDDVFALAQESFAAMDHLWVWAPIAVQHTLERVGLEGDVPLDRYLAAVEEARRAGRLSKDAAFEGLCAHFGLRVTQGPAN